MAGLTKIGWCDFSWNYWSGCEKVSPGCAHCYADVQATRYEGTPAFPNGFRFTLRPHFLEWPLRMTPGRVEAKIGEARRARIFVNSMSDVWWDKVPEVHVQELFEVMAAAPWHDFLILTKRPERMVEMAPRLPWPPHVWVGVSIENQRFVHRADYLREVPGDGIRFASVEPLLRRVDLTSVLDVLQWAIFGGESGAEARPMRLEWVRSAIQQAQAAGVPVFMKQTGKILAHELGAPPRDFKGEDPAGWPEDLRVQEFPISRAA
jgi:protein gp37